MKKIFTKATIVTIRTIRGKVDSTAVSIAKCNKTAEEIVRIAKENKMYYVIDLPDEEIRVVTTKKYPCLFEDLKGNKKTRIINQQVTYIFS